MLQLATTYIYDIILVAGDIASLSYNNYKGLAITCQRLAGGGFITRLQKEAARTYGSLRKLAAEIGLNASILTQVNAGFRKPWPKLRKQISHALKIDEEKLFNTEGWPRKN